MERINHPPLFAVVLCCALGTTSAHADTAALPALTTSCHLDLDAMSSNSGVAGDRRATSALVQWGGRYDTEAAGLWSGGLFEFSVEGVRSGGSGSVGTGMIQVPNNEWAPDFLKVYQATYRHDFGDGDVRAGIMDVSQYFEDSDQSALLHNSSFGMMPTVMANINGSSFPNPGLGAMGELRFGDAWTARGGVWQGEPQGIRGAFDHGEMSIAEVERDWGGGNASGSDLKLGAWHYSPGNSADGPLGAGVYLVGETRWKATERQWGAFVLGGTAPASGETVRSFVAAGVLVDAPITPRPNDQASVGFSRVALGTGSPETVVEAVYSVQISDTLAIQPDLQRVLHPGGVNPSDWLGGARLHLTF